ncbi:glucosaminidase domain-containing protein [Flavobacterium agricola]|uniref:Peptidoglycan hydrolase n=1 Tax=Flavobacterium agricola TaxID=2870839 RepID=A0ABY6LWD9_9FLAO|nr:glucosaminidase domain-containing protein [Flavobacterium agricola]UYW00566.1 glucosaminidase domain-containing protein [Flavobacterium agricola]
MKKYIYLSVIAFVLVGCSTSNKIRVTKQKQKSSKTHKIKSTQSTSSSTKNNVDTDSKTVVIESAPTQSTAKNSVTDYIESYKHIAIDNMKTHKIPASITMAQGILESGSGNGTLAQKANNHFGIKCHSGWTGASVRHDDDAAQECFRKYNDPAESYRDHSLFLTTRSRYNNLFKLDIYDYKAWARGLKAAGYATDPKYPDKLISLIERYNLQELDKQMPGYKGQIASSESNSQATAATYVVSAGDTLYSIARKFNTSVQNIKTVNNLSTDIISVGQILKI